MVLNKCKRHANQSTKSQFWRRAFIRSAFALIEGTIHFQKVSAFSYHERNTRPMHDLFQAMGHESPVSIFADTIPTNELALLLDENTEITDKGTCRVKQAFPSMARNIKFTFHMLSRIFKISDEPNYAADGWRLLREGIEIRNRITHPKAFEEFDIADAEIEIIGKGCQWFLDSMVAAMKAITQTLREMEEKTLAWLHSLPPEEIQLVMHLTSRED